MSSEEAGEQHELPSRERNSNLGSLKAMLRKARDNFSLSGDRSSWGSSSSGRDRPSSERPSAQRKNAREMMRSVSTFEGQVDSNVLSKFELGKQLGFGAFGKVVLATDKETGTEYACKIVPTNAPGCTANIESLLNEAEILIHVRGHANILKIQSFFEKDGNLYVIQELCSGGDLVQAVLSGDNMSEEMVAKVMHRILEAVAHCHALGVIHRDIKLDNFLLSSRGKDIAENLRLADFGCSEFTHEKEVLGERVGTMEYMAPEVFDGKCNYPSDIWSCGVVMFSMLCGRFPFPVYVCPASTAKAVKRVRIDVQSGPWSLISEEAKDCVAALLTQDPAQRPTAAQALEMQWFKAVGVARDEPLERPVRTRLKEFATMTRFKQDVLRIIADMMDDESKAGFRNMFENASGGGHTITKEAAISSLRERGMPEDEIQRVAAYFRYNSGGFLHLNEYIALVAASSTGVKTAGMMEQVYEIFDPAGDGFITTNSVMDMFQIKDLAEVEKVLKDSGAENGRMTEEQFYDAIVGPAGCVTRTPKCACVKKTVSSQSMRRKISEMLAKEGKCAIM